MLPRLHLVTDDRIITSPGFTARVADVLAVCGPDAVLHVRAHGTPAGQLYDIAAELAVIALRAGAWLLVNDRIDIAMAVRANGAQLGLRSLAIADARRLLGAGAQIGYSAHSAPESAQAGADGADFVVAGTIYATPSHPGTEPGGTQLLGACVRSAGVPVIAIGGVTPQRVAEISRTGAHGIAVVSGVWHADDAAHAAGQYYAAIRTAWQAEAAGAVQ